MDSDHDSMGTLSTDEIVKFHAQGYLLLEDPANSALIIKIESESYNQ